MSQALNDDISLDVALWCEDVRDEKSNKVSAIGILSGDILCGEFPAQIRTSFLFAFTSKKSEEVKLKIRLTIGDKPATDATATIGFQNRTSNLLVPSFLMLIEQAARVKLYLAIDGSENWVEAFDKDVRLGS